jgi:hypothetical protein
MEKEIINRVERSGLIVIDLEEYKPDLEIAEFDIADYLWKRIILKEKEFRNALNNINWSMYTQKTVAIFCSVDAIIPMWAYMLISIKLSENGIKHGFGRPNDILKYEFLKKIESLDINQFKEAKVVIKGCSKKTIGEEVYIKLVERLYNVVDSIMFGEPCSTVPIWKKTKKKY